MKWPLKIVKYLLIALVLVLVLVITAAPFAVRLFATDWLQQQGLQSELGYIEIGPMLGRVQIHDVFVKAPNGEALTVDELVLNYAWEPLRRKSLHIEEFSVKGLAVDVAVSPKGLRVGGVPIPSSEKPKTDEPSPLEKIVTENISLNEVKVCLRHYVNTEAGAKAAEVLAAHQCLSWDSLALPDKLTVGLLEPLALELEKFSLNGFTWSDELPETHEPLFQLQKLSLQQLQSDNMAHWQLARFKLKGLSLLPQQLPRKAPALALSHLDLNSLSVALPDTTSVSKQLPVELQSLRLGDVAADLSTTVGNQLTIAPSLMPRIDQLTAVGAAVAALQQPVAVGKNTTAGTSKAEDNSPLLPEVTVGEFAWQSVSVKSDTPLLSADKFALQKLKLSLSGDVGGLPKVNLGSVSLAGIQVLPGSQPALQGKGIAVKQLSLSDVLRIDEVEASSIHTRLEPLSGGGVAFAPQLLEKLSGNSSHQPASESNTTDSGAKPDTATGDALPIQLGKLNVDDISVATDRPAVALSQLGLTGFDMQGEAIALKSLALKRAQVLPATNTNQQPALDVQGLELGGLQKGVIKPKQDASNSSAAGAVAAAEESIVIDSIAVKSIHGRLQLDNNEKLAFAPELIKQFTPPETNTESAAQTSQQVQNSTSAPAISLSALALQSLKVDADRPLLSMEDLTLSKLGLQGENVNLAQLAMDNLQLLPKQIASKTPLVVEGLTTARLAISDGKMGLGDISLSRVQAVLEETENGTLAFVPDLLKQLPVEENKGNGANPSGESGGDHSHEKKSPKVVLDNFKLGDLSVTSGRELLSLQSLSVSGVSADTNPTDNSVAVSNLSFKQLNALQPKDPIEGVDYYVQLPGLLMNNFSQSSDTVRLDKLTLSDPFIFLHRTKNGSLAMLDEISALTGGSDENEKADHKAVEKDNKKPDKNPSKLKLALGEIVIGESGKAFIWDESVSPPLKQKFAPISLLLKKAEGAVVNGANQPSTLDLNIGINRFAYLKLAGDLSPFGEAINADIKGELNGLDVRHLSGYAAQAIGYNLEQGAVNADIRLKVVDNTLDSSVTTIFNDLEVASIPNAELPKGAEKLGVPLEFALSLIRDNDGGIKLKLPIDGDVTDPKFSLNDVITTTLFKVIGEAVINYYLPFGLVVKNLLQDGLSNMGFQPVLFAPGDDKLNDAAIKNLQTVTKMLQEKPQLSLVFCAVSTAQDLQVASGGKVETSKNAANDESDKTGNGSVSTNAVTATREQQQSMQQLAENRMNNAKQYLVDNGVKPGQAVLCTPTFESGNSSAPTMKVSIGK